MSCRLLPKYWRKQTAQLRGDAEATGLRALEPPDGLHQPALEVLEETRVLHEAEAQGHGETQRPLTVGHAREDGFAVEARLQGAAGGARRAPAAAAAAQGEEAAGLTAVARHLDEAAAQLATRQVAARLLGDAFRHAVAHVGPAESEGFAQHRIAGSPGLHHRHADGVPGTPDKSSVRRPSTT